MTKQEAVQKLRAMEAAIEKLPDDVFIIRVDVHDDPEFTKVQLRDLRGVQYEVLNHPHEAGKVYREKRALLDGIPIIWDPEIVEAAQ